MATAGDRRATDALRLREAPDRGVSPELREFIERQVTALRDAIAKAVAPRMRGAVQNAVYRLVGKTTDNAATEIFVNGNAAASLRLTLPDDTTWAFKGRVAARRMDADGESAHYEFVGTIDNNAGTVALVGSTTVTVIAEDTAAWTIAVDAANDALRVRVTGENSKTIAWVCHIDIVPVTG